MFSVYGYNKMALMWGMESNKNMLLELASWSPPSSSFCPRKQSFTKELY